MIKMWANYRIHFILIFALFCLILRIILVEQITYTYGWDVARDLVTVYKKISFISHFNYSQYSILNIPDIFRAQNLQWWFPEGPIISTTYQSLSPLYYILLAPAFVIFNYTYTTAIYLTSTLNVVTLLLIYFFTKKYYGIMPATMASLIWGFSYYSIKEGAIGLNPGLVPVFTMLALISIYKIYENEAKYIYLLCISIVGLLSFHASGFFIVPIIGLLLVYKIKIFRPHHYLFGVLIIFTGLFLYYLQEKMLMGKNTDIFLKYFVYQNSGMIKKIPIQESIVNFYATFSLTFGNFLLPFNPQTFGVVITTVLLLFSIYRVAKKDNSKIYIIFILYTIVFALVVKFEGVIYMGWWFYGVALPITLIVFSIFLNLIIQKTGKFKIPFLSILFLVFVFFNIKSIFSEVLLNNIQEYNKAKYVAEFIARDTKIDNFDLYFHTHMEQFNRINTRSPFKYLIANNSTNRDLFLKSRLEPYDEYFTYLNIYTISDISNSDTEKFANEVYTSLEKEHVGLKKPVLIYRDKNFTVYKSTFLNQKIMQ
ncbi:hypothetical protein KA001_02275 [Patescibacteria group bacterium]|nr:hypothetical protein [Patescibacteria group bacterium]